MCVCMGVPLLSLGEVVCVILLKIWSVSLPWDYSFLSMTIFQRFVFCFMVFCIYCVFLSCVFFFLMFHVHCSFGLDPLTSRFDILYSAGFGLLVRLSFEVYSWNLRFFHSIFFSAWVFFNVSISWLSTVVSIIFMIVLPWVPLRCLSAISLVLLSS